MHPVLLFSTLCGWVLLSIAGWWLVVSLRPKFRKVSKKDSWMALVLIAMVAIDLELLQYIKTATSLMIAIALLIVFMALNIYCTHLIYSKLK